MLHLLKAILLFNLNPNRYLLIDRVQWLLRWFLKHRVRSSNIGKSFFHRHHPHNINYAQAYNTYIVISQGKKKIINLSN